jgi:hypothetical protein
MSRRVQRWYRGIQNKARQRALDQIDCYYDPESGYLWWSLSAKAYVPFDYLSEVDRIYYGERKLEIMRTAKERYPK